MTRYILAFMMLALIGSTAHAAIIEQNVWDNRTKPGWDYSPTPPIIEFGTGSPSGTGALRMTYTPGFYSTSTSGGRAAYEIPVGLTELYFGHWFKFSPNFTFNPITTKIDYMWVDTNQINIGSVGAFTIREEQQGKRWAIDVTIQGNGQLKSIFHTVYASVKPQGIQRGQWYWLEVRVKMNDVIGTSGSVTDVVPNGEMDVWLNDVLQGSWNTLRWRDGANRKWKRFLHSPEWGGGGGTIAEQQYLWYDLTTISTTRIGRPTSTRPGDTTAPRSPTLNIAK